MKKFYIGFAMLLFLLIILNLIFSTKKNSLPSVTNITATPNTFPQVNKQSRQTPPSTNLAVIKTNPTDNTTQFPSDEPITIQFNQTITNTVASFSIFPGMTYFPTYTDNMLTLTPQGYYIDNTIYTLTIYAVSNNTVLRTIHFSTGTSTSPQPLLSSPGDSSTAISGDAFERTNHPDAFVAGKTPFSNNIFSINSNFQNGENAHYAFTITSSQSIDVAKNGVTNWLYSLGLTNSQIQTLDIQYQ